MAVRLACHLPIAPADGMILQNIEPASHTLLITAPARTIQPP